MRLKNFTHLTPRALGEKKVLEVISVVNETECYNYYVDDQRGLLQHGFEVPVTNYFSIWLTKSETSKINIIYFKFKTSNTKLKTTTKYTREQYTALRCL